MSKLKSVEPGKISVLGSVLVAIVVIGLTLAVFMIGSASHRSSSLTEKDFVGSWSSGEQSLTISAKGQAGGTDGCNGQLSKWSYTDAQIRFTGFLGTQMACPGADGKLIQGWLSKSASASFEDGKTNRLFFYDSKGKSLGSMTQSESSSKTE